MQDSGEVSLNRRELLKTGTAALAGLAMLRAAEGQGAVAPTQQGEKQIQTSIEGRIGPNPPTYNADRTEILFTVLNVTTEVRVSFAVDPADTSLPVFFRPVTEPGATPPVTPGPARPRRIRIPSSPVMWLTPDQFTNQDQLDGRDEKGFVNASVVVTGLYDLDRKTLIAHFVDVIPEENVIVGPLTANPAAGPLTVCGVPVQLSTDSRYSAQLDAQQKPVYLNLTWFPVVASSLVPSTVNPQVGVATVEGYASANAFIAQRFVAGEEGTMAFNPKLDPRLSVDRFLIRDDDSTFSIEGRGGVTVAHLNKKVNPSLTISRIDIDQTGAESRTKIGVAIFDIKRKGKFTAEWRLKRTPITKVGDGVEATPPEKVVIEMRIPLTGTTVEVICATDIREA